MSEDWVERNMKGVEATEDERQRYLAMCEYQKQRGEEMGATWCGYPFKDWLEDDRRRKTPDWIAEDAAIRALNAWHNPGMEALARAVAKTIVEALHREGKLW